MFKKPFVVLDLETSGIDPKRDDIIEVAMVRYEKGKEVKRYDNLIQIDYPLPEIITCITGITDEEIREKGQAPEGVFEKVEEILEGAYLIGHNIKFDFSFLQAKKIKMNIRGLIDTIPLVQILFPQAASYSLESLSTDFGLTHENKHRAMGDVEATLGLFKHLWKTTKQLPKGVIEEIQEILPRGDWASSVLFDSVTGVRPKTDVQHTAGGVVPPEKGVRGFSRLQGGEKSNGVQKPLTILEVFGEKGAMQKCRDEYEFREGQMEMADHVMNAFEQNYHLICEAPTGIGKSLAYLAPAARMAIQNKSKVVISTNTINLQQQLFEKDVPLLQEIYREATGNPGVRVALLKGRSHYLCLRRLAEFKRRPRFSSDELILLVKILVWQFLRQSDPHLDIHLTRPEQLIWDFELCADQKFCTPAKCRAYGKCYLHEARERAENADIIIVNHALLCADLASDGALLPEYQYLIIDEAHHFEEVATKAFSTEIKQENIALPIKVLENSLNNLKRRFEGTLFGGGKTFEKVEPILNQVPELQQGIDNFFSVLALFVNRNVPDSGFIEHLLVDSALTATEQWVNLNSSLDELAESLQNWMRELRKLTEALEFNEGPDFPEQEEFLDGLLQELSLLAEQLGQLKVFFDEEHKAKELIRWITSDLHGTVTVVMAPLLVGPHLKEPLYESKKSIILTSATLGVRLRQEGMNEVEQHPFTYLRQMLSLDEGFEEVILGSPFDYEVQTYIITPSDLLPVTARNSIDQISEFMRELIKTAGGSLLGLFTSYNALENIYLNLMKTLTPKDPKILAQRISGGRAKMMKAYLTDPKNSVLLGTASFWEGVDIAGDALTTLVIHKLPFDVPSDPIVKVRSRMFDNGFFQYSVPRAILRFRQGFGRLIRSQKDYGVMVILDNRVLTKEYGKMFLQALPENVTIEKMPLAEVPEKVKEWLDLSKKK